jgi:two-component system chemotaxis sensor kinase CheA
MDLDLQPLFDAFVTESEENLRTFEDGLLALESGGHDGETIETIFRMAHTLKGNAACLGLDAFTGFAHVVEDVLDGLRSGMLRESSDLISVLLRSVDAMREMVPASLAGAEQLTPAQAALLQEIAAFAAADTAPAPAASPAASEKAAGSEPRRVDVTSRSLRIRLATLDALLNLTGEMVIAGGRLREELNALPPELRSMPLEVFDVYERLFSEIQELVMKSRMVSIGPTLRQQFRTVREAAMATGKVAELVLDGEDVELDTTVIEHLRDPLTHMIRNALDHGIESPAVRQACGKAPMGTIAISARHEQGVVVIRVSDDGKGIDRRRIRDRGRSLGRPVDALSDAEVLRLIFVPGLSTAEIVTELSGRGVGMDVVKKNIERIRGSIHVESTEGQGTTVTIRVPLTLAIIGGLAVGVCGESYIIPLDVVRECLEFPSTPATADQTTGVMSLRGDALPYVRLGRHFGIDGQRQGSEKAVVVESRGERAALIVDSLTGETQTVIRPMNKLLEGLPGISGSAILGSGRVALILEVDRILDTVAARAAGKPAESQQAPN